MDKLWFKARRVISVLLVFAMLASLTPVQVFAEDGDTTPPVETNEPSGEEQTPPEGNNEISLLSEEGGEPATPAPTEAPVTPTEAPATPAPTEAPATPAPTEAPATPAPATPAPTEAPATPAPATPAPTESSGDPGSGDSGPGCNRGSDCDGDAGNPDSGPDRDGNSCRD